jgi:energy-converting hydrogenase B subunit D
VDKTIRRKGFDMIWQIELVILIIVIILAVGALAVKDLLGAAILFGAYSFMMCLLWAIMGAVDVAFTEASVGAGVSTVLFVAAVFRTSRRTED